jgi:hypothetical protein
VQSIQYDVTDVPTIGRFMESDAFIRGLMGPFSSGKSSGCLFDLINRGLRQAPGRDGVRRSRWAVVRNTYPQLRDTTIKTVHQWFPPHLFGRWRSSEHDYLINRLIAPGDKHPAQIEFLFRALDRPEHVRNLLSLELTGAWVNEAREVPWTIVDALTGRVDRFPARRDGGATWAGVVLDTNPPDTESDWYRFFEEADHTEAVERLAEFIPGLTVERFARIFRQPSGRSRQAENTRNNAPGYWHRLCIGKTDDWIKVYVDGDYGFVVDGRPVFEEYRDNLHCPGSADPSREPVTDERLPIQRGWDFGLTPACIFSQLSTTGVWKVVDELIATSMGVDRFSDRVLNHSARFFPNSRFEDIGDPSGESRGDTDERSCFDILHAKNIAISGGLQNPTIRQECVRKPLRLIADDGHPAFNIHPRCKITRRALQGGFHFRKVEVAGRGPRYMENPEKNAYSHPADALCYTATHLFGSALLTPADDGQDGDEDRFVGRLTDRTRSIVTGY